MPARCQNLRGSLHRQSEVAGHGGQTRKEQIAEAMSFKPFARLEAILKESREQMLVLRKRDHAVAQISGRQNVQVFTQASAGPAVIRDGNNCGEVGNNSR